MAFLIVTTARPSHPAEGGLAMARNEWPYLERYGYTWIQHPDGLYEDLREGMYDTTSFALAACQQREYTSAVGCV
jgi:hypothetical protein